VPTLGPLLLAYALGCISFAVLVGRLKGVDVREHGSGNPGATNVGRLLGKRWGRTVLLLDVLKGLLPVLFLAVPPTTLDSGGHVPVALAVVVGHVWPVTLKFRGGKGVATLGLPPEADPLARWADGLLLLAALALVVTLRHAGNFVRIRAGTEHRAGQSIPLDRRNES
jgi:acyl phosphate:glycerol-3-phosphate acyltransferase